MSILAKKWGNTVKKIKNQKSKKTLCNFIQTIEIDFVSINQPIITMFEGGDTMLVFFSNSRFYQNT